MRSFRVLATACAVSCIAGVALGQAPYQYPSTLPSYSSAYMANGPAAPRPSARTHLARDTTQWTDYNVHGTQEPIGTGTMTLDGSCNTGCEPCRQPSAWFGSIGGLIMSRDDENPYMFSYDDANESIQLTNSRDANFNLAGGFEARIGRYFNCCQNGLEVVYWGLFPQTNTTFTTAADVGGNLNGILNFDQLDYNGLTANNFVDNAILHGIYRNSEVHNVELNLLRFSNPVGGGRAAFEWIAGIRYFKFQDGLQFAADTVDSQFTGDPAELYYDIDVDNNLIGFQLGGAARFAVSHRLRTDVGMKFGIYGNHIEHYSRIGGAAGTAVINNGPNNGVQFLVDNTKDDVSFLGEFNLGLGYQISDRMTLTAGYRAVAVTGVALPTNQIYPDLRGIQDVRIVDSNGSLILHGGYLGLEYNY